MLTDHDPAKLAPSVRSRVAVNSNVAARAVAVPGQNYLAAGQLPVQPQAAIEPVAGNLREPCCLHIPGEACVLLLLGVCCCYTT